MKSITRRELRNCAEFMDLVRLFAEERMPDLPYHIDMTAEKICGDGIWEQLSRGERRLAGKCMKRLVAENELQLVPVDTLHEYPLYYQRR